MDERIQWLGEELLAGALVDTGHWQSLKGVPQTKTIELMNVYYYLRLPDSMEALQQVVEPNLPWAEEQFQERVSGIPMNPGESYKKWPWYAGNVPSHQTVDEREGSQRFSHTYMERFWPRWADAWPPYSGKEHPFHKGSDGHTGIRYRYGDLNDVVSLLAREPYTRQAYLPVFFPEDTGAHHGERVPCTLGYHFLLREGKLHINYFIRSCDYLRHFRDDVYLAGRLCQWVVEKLKITIEENSPWYQVAPGTLTMFISSLHVFKGDLPKMERDYG